MITNEEARKAIEKYQKEHRLPFGTMIDVTAISSKEGADLISQTIEKISKQIDEDTELWCICEMAKMYMQGVKPVYPVRPVYPVKPQGEWIFDKFTGDIICSCCRQPRRDTRKNHIFFCNHCGAKMDGGEE